MLEGRGEGEGGGCEGGGLGSFRLLKSNLCQVGNRGVSRLANLGRAAAKQPLLPPLCLKGQEALSWHLAHAKGGGATEQDHVPSRHLYTRTRSLLFEKKAMAVAAVAAPMVMALGVVADHAETSRWILLSSSLSPGQTGEQTQTTTCRLVSEPDSRVANGTEVHICSGSPDFLSFVPVPRPCETDYIFTYL